MARNETTTETGDRGEARAYDQLGKSALWLCPLDGARLTARCVALMTRCACELWPKSGPTIGACSIKASVGDHLILGRDRSTQVRIRVTNTDNGSMKIWTTGPYRLLATDGTDVHQ
jgi:hypothetical protein